MLCTNIPLEQYTHPNGGAQFWVCVNVNRGCNTPSGGVNNSLGPSQNSALYSTVTLLTCSTTLASYQWWRHQTIYCWRRLDDCWNCRRVNGEQ